MAPNSTAPIVNCRPDPTANLIDAIKEASGAIEGLNQHSTTYFKETPVILLFDRMRLLIATEI